MASCCFRGRGKGEQDGKGSKSRKDPRPHAAPFLDNRGSDGVPAGQETSSAASPPAPVPPSERASEMELALRTLIAGGMDPEALHALAIITPTMVGLARGAVAATVEAPAGSGGAALLSHAAPEPPSGEPSHNASHT